MAIHASSTGTPLLRGGDAPGRLLSTEELLALLGTRENAEKAIEELIAALDAADGDADLEPNFGYLPDGATLDECEGDEPDDEPSLGAPENVSVSGFPAGNARPHLRILYDQTNWSQGCSAHDEAEVVDEDGGDINDGPQDEDELDDDIQDERHDAEEGELTLGAPEGRIDQRDWAGEPESHQVGEDDEADGWRRPRARRVRYTERPDAMAEKALCDLDRVRPNRRARMDGSDVIILQPGLALWGGPIQ